MHKNVYGSLLVYCLSLPAVRLRKSGHSAKTEKQRLPIRKPCWKLKINRPNRLLSQLTGGTLDNPVVVVNPYGLSPLSALIQFNTETPEPVKVIVKGRSAQTDLSWTYEPATTHLCRSSACILNRKQRFS